jgi:hypothetical protein
MSYITISPDLVLTSFHPRPGLVPDFSRNFPVFPGEGGRILGEVWEEVLISVPGGQEAAGKNAFSRLADCFMCIIRFLR